MLNDNGSTELLKGWHKLWRVARRHLPRIRRRWKPLGARNRCGRLSPRRHKEERSRPPAPQRGEPWRWREPGLKTHDLSRLAKRRSTQGQSPHRQARSNGRKSLSGTHRGAGRWKIRQGAAGTCKPALARKSRSVSLSVALPFLSPVATLDARRWPAGRAFQTYCKRRA